MENKKITAIIVFEMMGRPPEHIKATLEKLLDTIGEEKTVVIKKRTVHKPKKMDNKDKHGNPIVTEGEIFSTFAEIEIEAEGIMTILTIAFKYMPAHIEIIYPENFSLDNVDFNMIVNEILARIHNYDAIAKSALMNNQVLASKINELLQTQAQQSIDQNKKKLTPMEISYGKKDEEIKPKKKTGKKK